MSDVTAYFGIIKRRWIRILAGVASCSIYRHEYRISVQSSRFWVCKGSARDPCIRMLP